MLFAGKRQKHLIFRALYRIEGSIPSLRTTSTRSGYYSSQVNGARWETPWKPLRKGTAIVSATAIYGHLWTCWLRCGRWICAS